LYALNALSGAIKWEYKTKGAINSTPLVAKGKVMFLSYDGFFYALNQSDGNLLWKFKTGGESVLNVKDYYNGSFKPDFWDFYLSSAVSNDNLVYFGSSDSNIYALDIKTGEKIWNYKTGGSIHSTPAISNNSIVVGSWDSNVYCLDATTGTEKWSYATGKDTDTYIWLGIQASPSIDNEIVYIGSRDAKFYAFNLKTGDTLWSKDEFDRSWMPSTAAIDKENIYTGSSDSFNFYSINKKTGTINYATKTNAYTFSSPAIDNEMGYIGSTNGRLYGIELASGDIKWEFETIGVKTDTINIFDDRGVMDVERYKALTKNITDMPALSSLLDNAFINVGAILSSPVISNQVIYFGSSDGYVYAISNKFKD
jgi:outer membrane protein assembly factor BamB